MEDKNKNYYVPKKTVFYLTGPQVEQISRAINDRAIDMDEQLKNKDERKWGVYSEDEVKRFLEILEPLNDLFEDLEHVAFVAPETEPVIKCELLYSKAMQESGKEVSKEVDRETRMADRYDVNMWCGD